MSTSNGPTEAVQTETTQTQPADPISVAGDYFKKLWPTDTGILDQKGFRQASTALSKDTKARLTEIEYTWKNGKVSMNTIAGQKENNIVKNPQGDDVFQYVKGKNPLYNYVLYLPKDYNPNDKTKKWPVVYFFHGIGEKGNDLKKLIAYGLPKYIKDTGKFDMIMIAPQCPGESHWADTDVEVERLKVFVGDMAKEYNINTDKQYLTGLSMGGRCTWKLALAMPNTFAAIAPVCGRSNTFDFSQITNLPIWMFHGVCDDTVSFDNVNQLVTTLLQSGNKHFKATVYPYAGHDSWTDAYNNEELYKWMLAQTLSK